MFNRPGATRFRHRLIAALALPLLVAAQTTHADGNPKYAGLVIDVISGKTLYADRADVHRYPASLTKMMTLYLVFEDLQARKITLDTSLTVSAFAAQEPPSKIGFRPGNTIKVRDAIKALVTKSANDVATTIAENLEGSEAKFAARMTETARRLGMSKTTFRNAHGLPDSRQRTTARDMAKLGIALQRDFPGYYGVFQTRVFEFRKKRYGNHNRLLGRVQGVDGIKTGFIRASGFNLVTSVRRDGRHIVAVVMGGRSGASRNRHMTNLVERTLPKAKKGEPMVFAEWRDSGPAPVPFAKPSTATLFASRLKAKGHASDDPIGSVLAFAASTRAAIGAVPPLKSGLTSVAVAEEVDAADGPGDAQGAAVAALAPARADVAATPAFAAERTAPAATVGAVAGTDAPANTGPPDAVESPAPATGDAPAVRAAAVAVADARAADRFDDAFRSATPSARLDKKALLAAIERNRHEPGITIIPMGSSQPGSAPRPASVAFKPAGVTAGAGNGWQIQVGAVRSPAEASRLLEDAEDALPAMRQRTRVMVPVETDTGTLYRARFAGFRSKDDASAACKRFSNHARPCWAVSM